jgi:monoterpene epsilon-lactone hydrolase
MTSRELAEFLAARAARPAPEAPPDLETMRRALDRSAPAAPADTAITATDAGGVPAIWVLAPGADQDRRMLFLHGGGFSAGSVRSHQRLAADLSRASGCAVLSADYRLAPEHPFPAAIEDALVAYDWMVGNGPGGAAEASSTFVGGDSAGGGLTLALLVALRDRGQGQAAAAATISPDTDLTRAGASVTTRATREPILSRPQLERSAARYLGDADPRHPLASPLFADLGGLPPLYMNVSDHELLLDDTLRFAAKAAEAGVEVTLHVEPGAFHDYPYLVPDAPESRFTLNSIGDFIRSRQAAVSER